MLEVPVTVAVNCRVCPACRVALVGEIVTVTAAGIVTAAEADFVESATEVAVTEKLLPVVDPAVNRPVPEIVPPVAVQVTAVLDVPVTVAVNCRVCPACTVALAGEIVTVTAAGIVTAAEADFVESATEVAVTEKLLPVVDPAVNRPVPEIVPPVAVQVTAVLDMPVTVAVNCRVCPACTVALVGETETLTGCMLTAAVADRAGSAAEVAVTVKLPGVLPAVYAPAVEIVPPVADQVTAVFAEPATVAVKAWCPPCGSVELAGDTVTITDDPAAITIVNFGRIACAPTVLTGRTISPGLLLTSMIPWFAAGESIQDCTWLASSGMVTFCAPTGRSGGTLKVLPAAVSMPGEEAPPAAQLFESSR